MSLRRTPLVLALSPLLALACDGAEAAEGTAPPRASEYRSAALTEALDAAGRLVQTRGFAPVGEEWRGFLVDQGSAVTEVSMHPDSCYVAIAAGSSALGQLDLRLFDGDGEEVAQDGQVSPRAALRHCPPHAGTFYLAVLATEGAGLFAARTYQGPTGLDVPLSDIFRGAAEPEHPAREAP